jgi:predicted DNA-binding transcriptional regulator AlpA
MRDKVELWEKHQARIAGSSVDDERQLRPDEVAVRLGVSQSWLAKARVRGDGPAFIKIGRSVRYSPSSLVRWLKSRERVSTS